ncbi:MAG TPA: 3-hydroxybutyrate dehydrogenase [Pirellulales bacterium]|nr:3-hydroxybutyrate dehydrogenase [Pirellulales bacterium]
MKDKVAMITGAASGIGKAIAIAFAAEGAKVVVADCDRQRAAAVVDEIAKAGGAAIAVEMDVTDERQVEAGVRRAIDEYAGIDILASNAGLQHVAALVDLDFADWKRLLAVHLDGAFLTTRACMRRMIEAGHGGTLIYLGSVHSFESSARKAPYVAAKHGLIGLAKTAAKEGAPHGIRANTICPGFVRTPLVEKQIPELAQAMGLSEADVIQKVMLAPTLDGEFTTTGDVAETAIFLAAFPSAALSGQSIVVSHGWHMQ